MGGPVAVLFDIDGTLVDSNYLHVEAWDYAFTSSGLTVPAWRVHRLIGADSTVLMDELLGDEEKAVQDAAKQLHDKRYKQLAPRLKILDQARELIGELSRRGARVVLATSAPQQELDRLLALLDVEDDTYAVTSSEDVKKAKPAPDIIAIALQKAGVDPGSAVMVGDSTWDITAAGRAGVEAIGLLSGGTGAEDLTHAGAVAIYDDVAALFADLHGSPLARLATPEENHA